MDIDQINDKEGKEDEEIYRIDNATMIGLKKFYDKDTKIQVCKRQKLQETFRCDWSIGMWYKLERQIRPVFLLNTERYRNLLREFMTDIHDAMILFNFVGYYCLKNMDKWVSDQIIERDKKGLQMEAELPFGIIRIGFNEQTTYGEYQLIRKKGSPKSSIQFECRDEALKSKYHFYVYDCGATFEKMSRPGTSHAPQWANAGNLVKVTSAFQKLYNYASLIEESTTCLMDANFSATHPQPFLIAKSLPDTNIRDVSQDVRFSSDSLSMATQIHGIKRTEIASKLAHSIRNNINQSNYRMNEQRAGEKDISVMDATVYNERKENYVRPDMKESLEILPELTDVNRGPAPISLIKPLEMEQRYESDICSIMHFPHFFYKPTATENKMSSHLSGDQVDFAKNRLYDEVVRQQSVFQSLFNIAYLRTFGLLDSRLFGPLLDDQSIGVRLHFEISQPISEDSMMKWADIYDRGLISFEEMRQIIVQASCIELDKNVKKRKLDEHNEKGDDKNKKDGKNEGNNTDEKDGKNNTNKKDGKKAKNDKRGKSNGNNK